MQLLKKYKWHACSNEEESSNESNVYNIKVLVFSYLLWRNVWSRRNGIVCINGMY